MRARHLTGLLLVALVLPASAGPVEEFAEFLEGAEKNTRTLPNAWNLWVDDHALKAKRKLRCPLLERGAETFIAEYSAAAERDPVRFKEGRLDLRIVPVLRAHGCAATSLGNKIVKMERELRQAGERPD